MSLTRIYGSGWHFDFCVFLGIEFTATGLQVFYREFQLTDAPIRLLGSATEAHANHALASGLLAFGDIFAHRNRFSSLSSELYIRYKMLNMISKLGHCPHKRWHRLRGFDYLAKVIGRENTRMASQ